jgi:hypothetical protein
MVGLVLMFLSLTAEAKQIKIAVIDTGYTASKNVETPNFCADGHTNLTSLFGGSGVPSDYSEWGHGTHIVNLIQKNLRGLPKNAYCIVVIKYHGEKISPNSAIRNSAKAFKRAIEIGADYINYSSSGQGSDDKEKKYVLEALNKNIKIIVSAGNEGTLIGSFVNDEIFLPFPASYDNRIITVGNLDSKMKRNQTSNYGTGIDLWEMGTDVEAGGVKMSGTSQAAAIATSKLVRKEINGH